MSNASTRCSEGILRTAEVPWITFLFLAIVFLVVNEHNLFWTVQERLTAEEQRMTAEERAAKTEQGSTARRISLICLGGFGMISLMRKSRNRFRVNGHLGWLVIFFLAWSLASVARADNIALTARRIVVLSMLVLGALALSERFSLRDIIWFVFFSASVYLIIGLSAELSLGTFHPFAPGYRFAGTFHPNYQGQNCAVLLIAAVFFAGSAKRGRSFFLAVVLVALIFLFLTRSRVSFAAAIIALFVYWTLVSSTSSKLALILGGGFTSCIILLLVGDALFPVLRDIVLLGRQDYSSTSGLSNLSSRFSTWKVCLSYVAERPLLGYGYNSFLTPRRVFQISGALGFGVGDPHSAYFQILLGVGLIGLAVYVLILVVGIKRSFGYYRASLNTGYAFLGVLLVFCVLHGLLESAVAQATFLAFLSYVTLARLAFQEPPD